jgi:hypothetical protein
MSVTVLPKLQPPDNDFGDLLEDLHEMHWLLARPADSLRDADQQADDLVRPMTRIDRSVALLTQSVGTRGVSHAESL